MLVKLLEKYTGQAHNINTFFQVFSTCDAGQTSHLLRYNLISVTVLLMYSHFSIYIS